MGLRNGPVYEKEEEEEEEERRRVVMEWEKQQQGVSGGAFYVKVMTDEQMELLRRQISVYAAICEQLVEMHKAFTAQQDSLAGMSLGNIYCDPLMVSPGHKITARQRWTPSPMQLQILESIFDQGNGTPNKVRIKEITSELTQHGPISENNVYNWFQNRRARSKRKQLLTQTSNGESEVETEIDSPKENKENAENNILSNENPSSRVNDLCFQSLDVSCEAHSLDPQTNKSRGIAQSNDQPKSSSSLSHMPFFDNVLSNPRMENLMGKMEESGNFSSFRTSEGYNIIG